MTEPDARRGVDAMRFEALYEFADLAASYAVSLREAAWRRELMTTELHLTQLRECLVAAIATFKELGRPS